MDLERLTGFVYPVKKNGVPVRGRWQLWVNLPCEPAFDNDGQPVLDSKGRQKQKYPKTTKVVEAKGKKAAERLLETWIAELEPTAPSTPTACSCPSSSTAGSRRPGARCASPATTPTGAFAGSTWTLRSARCSRASSRAPSSRPTTRRRCAAARRRSRWQRRRWPTTTRCSRPPTTGRSRKSCSS